MKGRNAKSVPPRFIPFGRYLLLERLAVGGMAEVYLAKRFDDDGTVSNLIAVKRILPALAQNDEFIRMFLDEAKIAARLDHPGIVQILELGRIGRSHYLAMDFVWGKDLLGIMRRVKLLGAQPSPSFVAWVGVGMCEALYYAHEKRDRHGQAMGLIHRDVSPQNVLVSFDGVVKLIDFGIAKAQSRTTQTQAGVLKGKIGYMSPEQIEGATVDSRSDLFAVGTCLYELLTLRTLFARENAFDAMENVRHVRAKPLRELRPDVPESLAEILLRAHAANPDERWQTAREMSNALRGFLSDNDPSYDRIRAVTWMRDAFRKEFGEERGRLDAFDQLGRVQVVRADEGRRNSATDLEIERTSDPAPPDWDNSLETVLTETPIPSMDPHAAPPEDGPTEVFFRHGDSSAAGVNSSPALAPAQEMEDVDVSLDPSEINSAIIQRMLPPAEKAEEAEEEKAKRTREATQLTFTETADVRGKKKPLSSTGWFLRIAAALALLAIGAAGAYLYVSKGARASIEVRTRPAVGAIVLLDGQQQGSAPMRIEHVAAGAHELTIIAPGYQDSQRTLQVNRDMALMVEVLLTPVAGSP